MKRLIFLLLLLPVFTQAQTPTFTFECRCESFLSIAAGDCDICNTTNLHSRKFTGLIVKFNGNPYRWIDAPYVVRVNDTLGIFDIWELYGTDRIRIDMQQTPFDSTSQMKDSLSCFCAGDSVFYQVVRLDTTDMMQRYYLSFDSTQTIAALVADDTTFEHTSVRFKLAQQGAVTGQVLKWNGTEWIPGTDSVGAAPTIYYQLIRDNNVSTTQRNATNFYDSGRVEVSVVDDPGNDETEVSFDLAQQGAVSGQVLRWNGTSWAPATLADTSATNELQTFSNAGTATTHTVTLSNSGGSLQLAEGTGIGLATSGTSLDGIATITNTAPDQIVTLTNGGGVAVSGSYPSFTLTATDQSATNELQTISAGGAGPSSYTIDLSNGGGAVTLAEGAAIDLTRTGNTITIASTATGTLTGAENGLNVVSNKARLGGNLLATTSIEGDGNEMRFFDGKTSFSSWTGFANSPVQFMRVQALEAMPTILASPTYDGIIEFRAHNLSGSDQPNSLTIGAYPTDNDGIWMQARSAAVPNFEYPLSLQPRGGLLSVGRTTGLDALVTFTGSGLAGSTAAGSVLLLENSEGNGKSSLGFGSGSDNITGEIAMFHATDAFRIINRNGTNGTSSIRIALGGETSDVASFRKSSAASLVQLGVGTTAPHSTIQSAGSIATAYLETLGAPTFDETKRTVVYTSNSNITWTIPSTTTCNCPGREYILHHSGTAGTITLSNSVSKGNGSTFNTISAGEWAYLIYGASGGNIRGYKLTSN